MIPGPLAPETNVTSSTIFRKLLFGGTDRVYHRSGIALPACRRDRKASRTPSTQLHRMGGVFPKPDTAPSPRSSPPENPSHSASPAFAPPSPPSPESSRPGL